jgi:hypothetical protein
MSQYLILDVRVNAVDDQLRRYGMSGGVGTHVGNPRPPPSPVDKGYRKEQFVASAASA